MKTVGFDRLVDFVVKTRVPVLSIPRNGIASVTHGVWLSDPKFHERSFPDPEFSSYSPQKMKAWGRLIKEVSVDPECPEFGASMSSSEYEVFIYKYFDKLLKFCANEDKLIESGKLDRLGDHGFYFRRKVNNDGFMKFSNIPDYDYEYLFPACDFGYRLLVSNLSRRDLKVEVVDILKSMCEDPYQFNRVSTARDLGVLQFNEEEAELFLARMRIFLRTENMNGLVESKVRAVLADRFIGKGIVLREIRDKSIRLLKDKVYWVVDRFDFDGIFLMGASDSIALKSEFFDLQNGRANANANANANGWRVSDWKGSRYTNYQRVAYDSLVKLWRSNSEAPDKFLLQKYWRDLAKDPLNPLGVRVDQKTGRIYFPGNKNGEVELESEKKTKGYIDKFVKIDEQNGP